jgi:long-chain acyl-CoA synthetase
MVRLARSFIHLSLTLALALFGLLTEETPNSLLTVDEIFLTGLKVGRNRAFLGHRQVISKNPLRFATDYTWQTYGEVDERRRRIGSALHALFTRGEVGGGDYDTVGIWSQNRPGRWHRNMKNVECT